MVYVIQKGTQQHIQSFIYVIFLYSLYYSIPLFSYLFENLDFSLLLLIHFSVVLGHFSIYSVNTIFILKMPSCYIDLSAIQINSSKKVF